MNVVVNRVFILCRVFGKCAPLEDQSYGVNKGSIYGTVHIATLT